MPSRVLRTVLGTLVARFRSTARRRASGARSGNMGAGSLTPTNLRSGLDSPMPRTITPVLRGRCRPSPDRVSEGASPDRDACRIVPGNLASRRGEWFLPVLGAPAAGVGGVDRDDGDVLLGGHRHQPGFELRGGEAGDEAAEALVAAVLLAAGAVAEVEVLDGDRGRPAAPGVVQEPGQGVPDLRVPVLGGAGEVVEEALRLADRVAVHIQLPGGEVVVIHVHPHHPPRTRAASRGSTGVA